jgi:hypothetical protein
MRRTRSDESRRTGEPISIRLSRPTDQLVTAEARRTHRSRSAIVQIVEDFGSTDAALRETHLTERQVRLALAYRHAFPDEVDAAIADNRRSADELEALYPFVETSSRTDPRRP